MTNDQVLEGIEPESKTPARHGNILLHSDGSGKISISMRLIKEPCSVTLRCELYDVTPVVGSVTLVGEMSSTIDLSRAVSFALSALSGSRKRTGEFKLNKFNTDSF